MLQTRPLIAIASASKLLNLTIPTVTASLQRLEKLGIVRETTGSNYARLYVYRQYLDILNAGTEPLAA